MSHTHTFITSNKKGYEVCSDCGTYHSVDLKPPSEIYENYWGDGTGRSTLEQQCENLSTTDECGISKVDRILQFVPKRCKSVLEIACAPGELLNRLMERNISDVFGIEPCLDYIEFICKKAPDAKVLNGYFPEVTKPSPPDVFDCIIGMDVLEHAHDYEAFIDEVHRLLAPNGVAILMSPIIYEDGFIRESEFRPDEHAYIFTKKFLEPYLSEKFSEVKFRRWVVSHEIIIMKK